MSVQSTDALEKFLTPQSQESSIYFKQPCVYSGYCAQHLECSASTNLYDKGSKLLLKNEITFGTLTLN